MLYPAFHPRGGAIHYDMITKRIIYELDIKVQTKYYLQLERI